MLAYGLKTGRSNRLLEKKDEIDWRLELSGVENGPLQPVTCRSKLHPNATNNKQI